MLNFSSCRVWAACVLLVIVPSSLALAQVPVITSVVPMANAQNVPRNTSVVVTFSQPLTAGSTGGLKVYSSQRGGLRGGGTAAVAGNTLTFVPVAYDFRSGETVQYTVTRAVAGAGGALAMPRVGQFTTAVSGSGRGAFAGGSDLSFTGVFGVATGDVDADGDLDLLVTNSFANTVSVRLNGGDATGSNTGTFSGTQDVTVGAAPIGVVLADIDGDGDLDLLSVNQNAGNVSVRLNGGNATGSGTGVFSGTQNISVGLSPLGFAVGDIDNDGDLDLLVASYNLNGVTIHLNGGDATGSNTGVFGGTFFMPTSATPYGVLVGDIDGDGDLDVLTANGSAGTVSICLNGGNANGTGTGTFASAQLITAGTNCRSIALGDVDGDGDRDLLVASSTSASVNVRLNGGNATGSNTGIFSGTQNIPLSIAPNNFALGDVDADGDLDLIVASLSTFMLSVCLNGGNGNGTSSGFFVQSQTISVPNSISDIALGDVDGDGDLDVLATAPNTRQAIIRLNGSTGPLATIRNSAPTAFTIYPNPATGRVTLTLPPTTATAELIDALGRVVRTVPATAGTGTLDVAGLALGLYMVRAAGQVARLVVE